MKTLQEYINEALVSKSGTKHLFKITKDNAKNVGLIEDKLSAFFKHSKKRYSFTNKTDLKQMFDDFVSYSGISRSTLKEFGLISGAAIADLITKQHDELVNDGWDFRSIKTFDETEREREYKKWKNSDDYVEGKKLRDEKELSDEPEDELKRTLVVYNADWPGNPDTTLEYDFYGKRGKSTDHQVNMIRVDYHYRTGINYYKANAELLSNYLKKDEEALKKKEIWDNSDLE